MSENIAKLLEDVNLSDKVKTSLSEAWERKLVEANEQISADLRAEYAQKYEHDRDRLVESVQHMVNDVVAEETTKLREQVKQLNDERNAIRESASQFNEFALKILANEVDSLRGSANAVKESIGSFKDFIVNRLDEEVNELKESADSVVNARIALIESERNTLRKARMDVVKTISESASKWLSDTVTAEFKQFHQEIDEARKCKFGMKIFEAAHEHLLANFFNENAEVQKLVSEIDKRDSLVESLKSELAASKMLVESTKTKVASLEEQTTRRAMLEESLSMLPADKRTLMEHLVASVPTAKLNEAIKKHLPAVLKGNTVPAKKPMITEARKVVPSVKIVTGDRVVNESSATVVEENVASAELQKLAAVTAKLLNRE